MATAATTTVAQVDRGRAGRRAGPGGGRDPGHLRRPAGDAAGPSEHTDRGPLDRRELAAVVAADIPAGAYVNLGIGLPTTVADHLPVGSGVTLHTENGMLGMGRAAEGDEVDWDLVNAGKIPVTETAGRLVLPPRRLLRA